MLCLLCKGECVWHSFSSPDRKLFFCQNERCRINFTINNNETIFAQIKTTKFMIDINYASPDFYGPSPGEMLISVRNSYVRALLPAMDFQKSNVTTLQQVEDKISILLVFS